MNNQSDNKREMNESERADLKEYLEDWSTSALLKVVQLRNPGTTVAPTRWRLISKIINCGYIQCFDSKPPSEIVPAEKEARIKMRLIVQSLGEQEDGKMTYAALCKRLANLIGTNDTCDHLFFKDTSLKTTKAFWLREVAAIAAAPEEYSAIEMLEEFKELYHVMPEEMVIDFLTHQRTSAISALIAAGKYDQTKSFEENVPHIVDSSIHLYGSTTNLMGFMTGETHWTTKDVMDPDCLRPAAPAPEPAPAPAEEMNPEEVLLEIDENVVEGVHLCVGSEREWVLTNPERFTLIPQSWFLSSDWKKVKTALKMSGRYKCFLDTNSAGYVNHTSNPSIRIKQNLVNAAGIPHPGWCGNIMIVK